MPNDKQIVQRIATKALIVNPEQQILILREADTYKEGTNVGRYHLPGGRLNPGEAFMDGLKREVAEETGLTIKIGRPIYVGEWRPTIKGVPNQIVAMYFICKTQNSKVRLSDEHDKYVWITPNQAKIYDLMSPVQEVINEYTKTLNTQSFDPLPSA